MRKIEIILNVLLLDLMNKIIKKSPTSRAAEEFMPFIELLKNENFEKTQKVEDYWKKLRETH